MGKLQSRIPSALYMSLKINCFKVVLCPAPLHFYFECPQTPFATNSSGPLVAGLLSRPLPLDSPFLLLMTLVIFCFRSMFVPILAIDWTSFIDMAANLGTGLRMN